MTFSADAEHPREPLSALPAPKLRRSLGLWHVAFSGMGVILGAGVYALIGPASGLAGSALWLSFLLAGVAAGLTAYTYARLGVLRPRNSPEFQYTAMAFGDRTGSVAGWQMLAADLLAAAAVSLGFGGYLAHLAGVPIMVGSLGLLAVIAIVGWLGVAESVGLGIFLLFVDIAGLIAIILIGLPFWPQTDFTEMPTGLNGVWTAVALIFFAYLGFDEIGNFAEEMENPERDLPRALIIAMVGSTAIYILVALSAVAAVGWRDLSASDAPLALVAGRSLGSAADSALSVIALAATGKTVLLLLLAASRSVYGMAAAGVLPRRLSGISHRGTPVAALALVIVIPAVLLVALGELERVAGMTNATILFSFLLTNLSLFWLAVRGRLAAGLHRRVADLFFPGCAVLLCGWLLVHTGWANIAVAAVIGSIGLVASVRMDGEAG